MPPKRKAPTPSASAPQIPSPPPKRPCRAVSSPHAAGRPSPPPRTRASKRTALSTRLPATASTPPKPSQDVISRASSRTRASSRRPVSLIPPSPPLASPPPPEAPQIPSSPTFDDLAERITELETLLALERQQRRADSEVYVAHITGLERNIGEGEKKGEVERLGMEVERLKEENRELAVQLVVERAAEGIFERRARRAEGDLVRGWVVVGRAEREVEDAEERVGEFRGELEGVRRDVARLRAKNESLTRDKIDFDRDLKETLEELKKARRDIGNKEKRIAEVEEKKRLYKRRSEHFEVAADGHLAMKREMKEIVKVLTGEVGKMRGRPVVMKLEKEEGRGGRVGFGLDWDE